MRKSTFAIALPFLAAIVWFGSQLNQPRAAEDAAKPAIQKWEYHCQDNGEIDQAALNNLGEKGWEACGISTYITSRSGNTGRHVTQVLFKRLKQ
jgi:hypothetical protein